MSKHETLRALVTERLTVAADEIFALFERTIADYEEELCRSKEKNQRKQQRLDTMLLLRKGVQSPLTSHDPGLCRSITETPGIKEEPAEHRVKQEEEELPVPVTESRVVCVKSEPSLFEQGQTEHREEKQEPHYYSETENEHSLDFEGVWTPPFSCSTAQMETYAEGDNYNQVQIRDTSATALKSNVPFKYKCAAKGGIVNNGDMSERNEGEEKKHQCSVCSTKLCTKQSLEIHKSVHTGERSYGCLLCDKKITQTSTLKLYRRHIGEKLFSCPICKKRFTGHYCLKRHMRTHTGETPYSCLFCNNTFVHKTTLDKHTRIHTGEKPFICSICEKDFTTANSLKIHMRMHTGEKPFSCPICKKEFSVKSNLKKHLRTHSGEKPYKCPLCNKAFGVKGSLQRHVKTHEEREESQWRQVLME